MVPGRVAEWLYIALGQPQQNGFIEPVNGWFRDECLTEQLLRSLSVAGRSW
jgi:putative transposase